MAFWLFLMSSISRSPIQFWRLRYAAIGYRLRPSRRCMRKKGEPPVDFWTDEQWAILEPMELKDRVTLVIDTIFSKRGLIGEAKHQGLTQGGRMAQAPGCIPRPDTSTD